MMTESSFTINDLGKKIAELLHLQENDRIEVQRNKLNHDELKIIRHASQ